jgi:site-specific recombinase XerC
MTASSLTAAFMDASLRLGKASTRTREERHWTFQELERFAKAKRFNNMTPSTLTLHQVQQLVKFWQDRGVKPRTLQNRMSHIRAALKGVGLKVKAEAPEWSNAKLGIASRPGDRVGKHRAIADAALRAAQEGAAVAGERGREFVVLTELQRCLGLRASEAVQSAASLAAWQRSLQAGRPVEITLGTKGGRPRVTFVPESLRARALQSVEAAQVLAAERGGRLIAASSLRAARERYLGACAEHGLKGEVASHGLRYAFAHDRFRAYLQEGIARPEALRRLSSDLGHGDGRGRYVKMIYLRGFEE